MLRIDITPFGVGAHHVTLDLTAEALDLDPETFDDIRVEVDLFRQRHRILAAFHAHAMALLVCDRTLRPFELPVEGGYSVLFAEPGTAYTDEGEHDEVRELLPTDREIDLTDVVRDTLLLAVPQRKVAPGAEDEAIETVFGAPEESDEKPVDPRWEKLRTLRSDDEKM